MHLIQRCGLYTNFSHQEECLHGESDFHKCVTYTQENTAILSSQLRRQCYGDERPL